MPKVDAYQMVTDRICAMLERGVKPWARPWETAGNYAWSGVTGKRYSFINQMLLMDFEKHSGLAELLESIKGEWLTFKQVQSRGGKVRAGEHGKKVVFYKPYEIKRDDDGEESEAKLTVPLLTVYTVFHIRQCEGIEQKYHRDDKRYDFEPIAEADRISSEYAKREGVIVKNVEGERACYSPSEDTVTLPLPTQFADRGEYYSTLYHELVHSTGHERRLNRLKSGVHFADEGYTLEELVAEIGSASIMATLGIESQSTFENSAAYIHGWLEAIKADKRLIVSASSKAEKAIQLILGVE